ncbi:ATP-binding protein [Methanocella arvoryzae]|uniref:Carbon monoxide dehydrogenase maturation factor (Accessory nickel-insertion protein) n=1 Tax=Methanocella arvoryzae (strain DSM 22066 / NBRC 105507 / MRE50) TaxID=351160 RepID=Q0W876_METAR|nr:AAA family ATPase [Methanocella arvoryzae]CAJ35417.1 putative carbon monoxide dehydrogenase maturation factor (accessory nickel-insertion protein) [Methanocella arvoryzae MRE50]
MKRLVTAGRGGTGKTSFVALMTKYFLEKEETPVLLVDVDPDQNLAEMVGVDLESEGVKTIAELVTDTFLEKGGTSVGISPADRIEAAIFEHGLYEGETFDLLAVGTRWIEGCYCLPDEALKSALQALTKNYRYVLIDSPAGLEHLNRKIATQVNDVFAVMGPSHKSFENAKRSLRIMEEIEIGFDRFYLVGGCLFPEELEKEAAEQTGQPYLGKIEFDRQVQDAVIAGRSLLDLPDDSQGYASVKRVMEKAGYR